MISVENGASGLYIHIPYCRRKCLYCDFFSGGVSIAHWHRLAKALLKELSLRKGELTNRPTTIYFGGGTPSLMPPAIFRQLCSGIAAEFSFLLNTLREFTLEVNPEDVTEEAAKEWKEAGVSRISIGIQSFHDDELKSIGRGHSAEEALKAYNLLSGIFDNISIDLIYGLPGQSMSSWEDNLRTALSLEPQHISLYSLMYEPGTALTALRDRGRITETDEAVCADMYRASIEAMRKAGYDHYEISNFARPGFRSLHNSSYWHGTEYLGLGPSAHSYDGKRTRRANPADISGYLATFDPDSATPQQYQYSEETLSDEELFEEYILTRMRCREGISLDDLAGRFGEATLRRVLRNAEDPVAGGLLIADGNRLALSEEGIFVSDNVILRLAT